MPHSTEPDTVPQEAKDEDQELPDAPPLEGNGGMNGGAEDKKQDVKLDDIFNDEDSDDEFTSSSVTLGKVESSPPAAPV